MRSIITILFISYISAQSEYPADSLLASPNVSIIHKIGLLPIAGWQRISYNTKLFNCQFYPSCSNYGADAVRQFGIIRGGIMTSERIIRCNPFAFHYHLGLQRPFHDKDGRLIDPVVQIAHSKKSPHLAALFSAILPGSGRIYSGRILDGIMGLWTFYLVYNSAYYAIKDERTIAGPILGTVAVYVYLGEIYGGWRAAQYYQKSDNGT